MTTKNKLPSIVVLGDDITQGGSYLLRLRISEKLQISFGRFKKGKVIQIPPGECIYIGSALSNKGAMSLGRRLVRHATRTGRQTPHFIRADLIDHFQTIGLGQGDLRPQGEKKLFWNVDHLLDQPGVTLTHIILIRSLLRLEPQLGQLLEQDPCTSIMEKGLGANDVPGNTHLLQVRADEAWWVSLVNRLDQLLEQIMKSGQDQACKKSLP